MGCGKNIRKNNCCDKKDPCSTPIRYQGPDIECAGISQGETIDDVLRKMSEFICDNVAIKGDDGVGISGAVNNGDGTFTLNFTDGTSFTTSNFNGEDGLVGRGVAVFNQESQPDQNDFDNSYGTVDGFGQNGLPGSGTFKSGDLWIQCNS